MVIQDYLEDVLEGDNSFPRNFIFSISLFKLISGRLVHILEI